MDGVFPRPAQLEARYRFAQAYQKRIYELPRELRAGDLPNDQELIDESEIIAEQKRRKQLEEGGDDTATTAPPTVTPPIGRGAPPPTPPPSVGRGAAPVGRGAAPVGRGAPPGRSVVGRGGPPPGVARGGSPAQSGGGDAATDEVRRRAAIKKARTVRVYASPDYSFHVSPIARSEEAPSPRDMWYAQVGLWVQEDLVKAIARLNDEAAEQLGEKDAGVLDMPVKRIENIRVRGYVTSAGTLVEFPTEGAGPRQTDQTSGPLVESFTGRKSDDHFDVIRVVLSVIVDERDLLKLIDAITRANFYQLVGIEYSRIPSEDPLGYYYGSAPVVHATLDFEGYMARKLFKGMMPAEVLQDLGIVKAEGTPPPP